MNNNASDLSETVVFIVCGICFFLLLAGFNIYFLFFYRRKRQEHEEEQKQLEIKYNQALLESQVEIQEELLQHISREIHDNLGQVAGLIKLNLLAFPPGLSAEAHKKLEETRELMRKLMGDIKALSLSLNTDYLSEEGLYNAIQGECDRLNRLGLIQADFFHSGIQPALDSGKQIFIYRMFQELVSNTLKYAQATDITVQAQSDQKQLVLEISDNGKGFNVEEVMRRSLSQKSTGLRGMQKRCKLIGADLELKSLPGQGTTVRILLNL